MAVKNKPYLIVALGVILAFGVIVNRKLAEIEPAPNPPKTQPKPQLTGRVLDPEGKPAPRVWVCLLPYLQGEQPTDNDGRFTLSLDSGQFGGSRAMPRVVVARDLARNLVCSLDLDGGTTHADLKLEPAWTLAGRVVDTNGAAIPGAEARAALKTGHMTSPLGSPARADAEGRFELKALPPGRGFSLQLTARGFGPDTSTVEAPEGDSRRIELDAVQLLAADQRIAGVVLDTEDQPVGGAWVSTFGRNQPQIQGQTDPRGRFEFRQVCAAPIQVSVNTQRGLSGHVTAEGGDTNISIHIAPAGGRRAPSPPPPGLQGKPLPDLAAAGLTADDAPANQRLLAALVDVEQRPSRRVLKRLTELADMLKEKGVAVVVLQAGAMDGEAFAAWNKEAALPFPAGVFKGNREKTRAAWGAAALPWLILTDVHRQVTDDGFAPGELEEKLNSTEK